MWIWNTNHSGDFWSKRTCSWKRTWETIHATFLPESMASSLPLSSTTIKLPALSKRDLNFTFNPSSLLYHISEIRFPKNHISFTRSVPKYVPQLLKRVLYKTLYTQIRMRLIENTVLMSYDWAKKKSFDVLWNLAMSKSKQTIYKCFTQRTNLALSTCSSGI